MAIGANSSPGERDIRQPSHAMPLIDVTRLLAMAKSPPHIERTSRTGPPPRGLMEYVIWRYVVGKETIPQIAQSVGYEQPSLRVLLKRYGFFQTYYREPWTAAELERAAKLVSFGEDIREVSRKFGKRRKPLTQHLQSLGLWKRAHAPADWVLAADISINTICSYKRYARTIRHYTNTLYSRFAHIVDPEGLRGRCHHLDHCLSIYDGFNKPSRPLPWQYLCHPANFRIVTGAENSAKGSYSIFTVKQLQKRIADFEAEHGIVSLPLLQGQVGGEVKYSPTRVESVQRRIEDASTFTLREIRRLGQGKVKVRKFTRVPRSHLTRENYEYVIAKYLGDALDMKYIAKITGINHNTVALMLKRAGIPRPNNHAEDQGLMVRLRDRGLTVSEIARRVKIPKRAVVSHLLRKGAY